MKSLPAGLITLTESITDAITLSVALKFTIGNGTVYRINDSGKDLTINSEVYNYLPGYSHSNISTSLNSQIDNFDVTMPYINSNFKQLTMMGALKNAPVEIYIADWTTPTTYRLEKKMKVGEYTCEDRQLSLTLIGIKSNLDTKVGFRCTKTCQVDLGSSDCTINLAGFTTTGSVTSITSNRQFADSGLGSFVDNYFQYGLLTWTSGNNNGWSFVVKQSASVAKSFVLYKDTFFNITIGDDYSVYAGCNKSKVHCEDKFNNLINFRDGGGNLLPNPDKLLKIGVI